VPLGGPEISFPNGHALGVLSNRDFERESSQDGLISSDFSRYMAIGNSQVFVYVGLV
jgi:hypothetical protein